ncbi:MAG TPA: twin-arginine translocation signal domain-containing protein, partial [Dactylosporangium sp.]|nr:twin-arginine translocation signal domain-containing protein [Dactylosporangium sp.]
MGVVSRRNVLVGGAAAVAAGVVGAEQAGLHFGGHGADTATRAAPVAGQRQAQARPARLIGDGSTSDTGPQPLQPTAERLAPGERPPQFVVFSWDGAGEDDNKFFSHFRQVAQETKATMTFFLSGIYTLPRSQR